MDCQCIPRCFLKCDKPLTTENASRDRSYETAPTWVTDNLRVVLATKAFMNTLFELLVYTNLVVDGYKLMNIRSTNNRSTFESPRSVRYAFEKSLCVVLTLLKVCLPMSTSRVRCPSDQVVPRNCRSYTALSDTKNSGVVPGYSRPEYKPV